MARDLTDTDYYISHGGKIPVKWTAPEVSSFYATHYGFHLIFSSKQALYYQKYSTASDVWSFGCVMYEIWSLGHTPFEKHTHTESIKLVIDKGIRLAPPPGCPRFVYKLMMDYW
jgi:serine/threonine protein kinase